MNTSTLPPLAGAVGASTAVRIVGNETSRSLRIVWTYRATLVASLATMLATYLALQYFIGGGVIVDELVAMTAPGLFAYIVAFLTTLRVVAGLLEERNTGTLEQTHLSPLPAWQLVVGRLIAATIEAVGVGVLVVGGILLVRGVAYPLAWAALVPLILTVAGILGLALLLAAASFSLPGIGALLHIVHMLVMMLNGTIVPAELFPRWLELIARLIPSTLGISATRRVLIDGISLGDLSRDGSLGWLLLYTAVLVVGGWSAYHRQVHRALRDGRMGP